MSDQAKTGHEVPLLGSIEQRFFPVTLDACPPGLFLFDHELGFKTEYQDINGPEAYCVASGEYFWGGTDGNRAARRNLIVTPVIISKPSKPLPPAGSCNPESASSVPSDTEMLNWLSGIRCASFDRHYEPVVERRTSEEVRTGGFNGHINFFSIESQHLSNVTTLRGAIAQAMKIASNAVRSDSGGKDVGHE